jgi:hypothetical protein
MSKEPTILEEIEVQLRDLEGKPLVVTPASTKPFRLRNPTRLPLVAETPEQLLDVLELTELSSNLKMAGVLAFASRNPGQAKKMPEEWVDTLINLGAMPPDGEWDIAIQVGELIANHRFVKTPMAHRDETHENPLLPGTKV